MTAVREEGSFVTSTSWKCVKKLSVKLEKIPLTKI
jgi:hypothetical protein